MSKESVAMLMTWLPQGAPDDWHRVALSWNWDNGIEPLLWIASQSGCDAGTAMLTFWKNNPDYFLQFRDRNAVLEKERGRESEQTSGFDLCGTIVDRWTRGLYTRRAIACDPDKVGVTRVIVYRNEEATYAPDQLPWTLPDDLALPLSGRNVTADDFVWGYPPTLVAAFKDRGIPFH